MTQCKKNDQELVKTVRRLLTKAKRGKTKIHEPKHRPEHEYQKAK